MTQPTERRFVMEPRLDAEVATLNADKISHGTVVNSDVATGANIAANKIAGTAVTQADTGTVTSTMIANGTIVEADIADGAVTSAKIANGTIVEADIADGAVTSAKIANGTIVTADLASLDSVQFNTAFAGGSTAAGQIAWNDVDGTLEFKLKGGNVTLQIGQEQVIRVKNNTGSTLNNGKAVYISGSDGNNLRVAYANAGAENTSSGTIGVLTEDLNNGNAGYVTTFGLVRDINTSTLTEGAPVWLSTTDGVLTATRPAAPAHGVMIGFCLRSHAVNGVVFVRVDNGWELDELHNVLITTPTNGQALTYDSATGLWKNATPVNSLSGLSDVAISAPAGGQVIKYNAGTSKWVNGAAAGGVTAQATAPSLSTAASGDAWFDTNDGTLYVCYVDADSTKQWVQVQANSALEATILGRLSSLEGQAIAYGNMSPNYLINGAFDFNQRGLTSTTSTGYGFDRWATYNSGGTTYSAQTFTPGAAPVAGYEGINYARIVTSGQSGTSAYTQFAQKVEDVRTIAGRTVTLSFWAKAASGAPKVSLELQQNFGTGGSPSVSVETYAGQVTLSTSWARYSITAFVPSISGKTIGTTANSSYTQVSLWTSAGTDFNSRAGSIGIQSNTFDFWGMQLENGSVATAFRRNAPSIQAELAACQRYYQRVTAGNGGSGVPLFAFGSAVSATLIDFGFQLPVTMRTNPSSIDYANIGTYSLLNGTATDGSFTIPYASTTIQTVRYTHGSSLFTTNSSASMINTGASAGYIGFSAEL